MRKLFVLLFVAVMLAACGEAKVHENVDEDVAKDSMQVMDVIKKNVNKEVLYGDASEGDKSVVDSFASKYTGTYSTKRDSYDGVDEDILIIANASVVRYKEGITLDTEKEELNESYEELYNFIETGEGYDIDKSLFE